MFADFNPLSLGGLLIAALVAAIVVVCLLSGLVLLLMNRPAAADTLLKFAGICFLAGLALIGLTVAVDRLF